MRHEIPFQNFNTGEYHAKSCVKILYIIFGFKI